jgi:hypothetical protein
MLTGISRTKAGVNFRVSGLIASSEAAADLVAASVDLEKADLENAAEADAASAAGGGAKLHQM